MKISQRYSKYGISNFKRPYCRSSGFHSQTHKKLTTESLALCHYHSRWAKNTLESNENELHMSEWVKSFSHVQLFVTPWTAAYQALPSMGFSRQGYWSGLPFPSRGDLSDPGIEPRSLALEADALPSEPPGKSTCITLNFPAEEATSSG